MVSGGSSSTYGAGAAMGDYLRHAEPVERRDARGEWFRAGDWVRLSCGAMGAVTGFTLLSDPERVGVLVFDEEAVVVLHAAEELTRVPGGLCRRCAGTRREGGIGFRDRECTGCGGRGKLGIGNFEFRNGII